MSDDKEFHATASWGSRREGPEALAERWITLITRLQAVDPVFARWYHWRQKQPTAFEPDKSRIARFVEAGVGTNDDDGSPQPLYGYSGFMLNTTEGDGPRAFGASMHAGTGGPYCFNSFTIDMARHIVPDPDVVTYRVFRGIVLALAESFEPASVIAYPVSAIDLWSREGSGPTLNLAWISYLGPRYAHLVTPPSSAFVERQPDGGLLLAATTDPFDIRNHDHMAAARAIKAAGAPFNAFTLAERNEVIAKGYG